MYRHSSKLIHTTIIYSNKMNIILLFIWLELLLITLMCFYYNEKILTRFEVMNTPKQDPGSGNCVYGDIPTIDVTKLQKCKEINDVQTYIHNTNKINYMVSASPTYYVKACSGLCTKGVSDTGNCLDSTEDEQVKGCEALIKPAQGCLSTAKPIFDTVKDSNTTYYYINGPINSLNSCS